MGRWCGLRSVSGKTSEAVDGARHVGGNKVTVAVLRGKAAVTAWLAELGRVIVGAGLQGEDKCVCAKCYDPPQFFSSLSDPLLVTLSTPKRPLPLNPPSLPDLPPLPPSEPSKPLSPLDQPPVEPLVPVPWNIYRREYSSMEMYQEPTPVENPLEDPDSPMEDAPPLEPEPFIPYEPDVPGGQTHTLSPEESPIEPWEAYLIQPSSPVSHKRSLSPTSSSSAPIRQCTSREGSYQSITPPASSPIAGTSPQSQGYQSTPSQGSADNPSSTQSSAEDVDSNMALNWVTINTDYLKG